ncbi:MAG TPA: response regulator [Longimicrobiales bacterium]
MDSVFAGPGYAVLRAFNAAQALQRVAGSTLDLLIVDKDLRDASGIELCREMRNQSLIGPSTPTVLIAPGAWHREDKLAALREGAWDVCSLPTDGEELFLRVDTWVRAKLAADQTRDQGLLDPDTGLYNAQGLLRRISELGAGAARYQRPLACVVLSPQPAASAGSSPQAAKPSSNWVVEAARTLSEALAASGRASDAIGRLSATEFVILAPDTDADGVIGLAERLRRAMDAMSPSSSASVRFGCYAVPNFSEASITPSEMLVRAAEALRGPQTDAPRIQFFNRLSDIRN